MAQCRGYKWTKDLERGWAKGPSWTARVCACKAKTFVKVTYSHVAYGDRSNYNDVFGFCAEHAKKFTVWRKFEWVPRPVHSNGQSVIDEPVIGEATVPTHGLRGQVSAHEVLDDRESDVERELLDNKRAKIMMSMKADLKRRMHQENRKDVTMDEWREVFDEALNEFTVEKVMRS